MDLGAAAASILAKVHRDELMTKWAEKYEKYGWKRNAGYGTREHREAIEKYGITPSLIRISIGIENSEDIITDMANALEAVAVEKVMSEMD